VFTSSLDLARAWGWIIGVEHCLGDPQVGWRGLDQHQLGDLNVGELVIKIRVFIIFILSSIHCQFPRGSRFICSQHLVKMQKKKLSCNWKFI
jgi:hypothetical protein